MGSLTKVCGRGSDARQLPIGGTGGARSLAGGATPPGRHPMTWWASVVSVALVAGGPLALTACGGSPSRPSATSGVSVKASDTACEVATTSFKSGTQTFAVSNAGSQVTEVYIYAPGNRIVGEVENIGPSSGKRLTVALNPGQYQVACKPGMVGKGIRTAITVKAASGAAPTTSPQLDAAVANYHRYVLSQAELLQSRVRPFVVAVQAGDIAKAKSLYAAARAPYEAIKPVAESFGDLDPRIDARIDNVESGQEWTGFHRLEHDLWKTSDISQDGHVATQLQGDVAALVEQVQQVRLGADQIGNGAKTLLEDVAISKVTGEEERYSRLDLVDFSADVEGADRAYTSLRPIVLGKDPKLVSKLDTRFAAMQQDLALYGSGSAFERYDSLSKAQIRSLASDVNALIEPLSELTASALKAPPKA
jgi:iron uptake system component EfeO